MDNKNLHNLYEEMLTKIAFELAVWVKPNNGLMDAYIDFMVDEKISKEEKKRVTQIYTIFTGVKSALNEYYTNL